MEHRECPTRIDGADVLIAHSIDTATCQGRQAAHYHKCHACVHHRGADLLPVQSKARPESEKGKKPAAFSRAS